jgi:gliding motility-associated-like protein
MKTFYPRLRCKILAILLTCLFFQAAHANNGSVSPNKLLVISTYFNRPDTPKISGHPKLAKKVKKTDKDKDNDELEDGKDDNIRARAKQEFLRTRDPALNIVPVERLLEARKMKDQLMSNRANSTTPLNSAGKTSIPISDIQWTERGPNNVGGRTRALIFDLNDAANGYKKVFAGGVDGGLWYTTDITATPVQWNKIDDFFDNIAISCITQNPFNPKEIYAGTGEGWYNIDGAQGLGVWKSSDGGATWKHLTSTKSFQYITSILVDKNQNVYLSALGFGIEKSVNGGTSWKEVIGFQLDGADLQLAANGDVYASTGIFSAGRIFVSDFAVNGASTGDFGTWKNISPDPYGTIVTDNFNWWRIKLACAPGNADVVYALMEGSNNYNLASIQQYSKSANKWTVKTVPPGSSFSNQQAWYSIAAAVDPNDANILYAGSLDAVKSTDGGSTWTPITQWTPGEINKLSIQQYVHADHHAYTYAPGSSARMLMGTDGGVFYTTNANATGGLPSFVSKDQGYNVTQFYSVALHPTDYNFAFGGTQDNGTQQFTSAGMNTTNEVIGGDGGFAFIDQLNPNIQIGSYTYSNYFISTDGGKSFADAIGDQNGGFINPADYDSKHKSLYAGSFTGAYIRWTDVPLTSTTGIPNVSTVDYVNLTGSSSANVTSVTVAPVTPDRVYFGLDNGQVAMVDHANYGTSKTSVLLNPDYGVAASVSCVAVDPKSEDHILVTYSNYGVTTVFETRNATAAKPVWAPVQGNLPDMPVYWAIFYPGDSTRAIIATELGVWTTEKLEGKLTTWDPSNSGLANVRVNMLKFRAADRTIAAATHGRGLFTATLNSNNALLSALKLSNGTLNPVFATGTTSYTASVPNLVDSVMLTPTTGDPTAKVTVNGKAVGSVMASGPIALKVGPNTLTTVVNSSDGSTSKTYTVTVTRAPSNNDNLVALSLKNPFAALTASSGPGDENYVASVPNIVTSITAIPVTADPTATVAVNGQAVMSGMTSGPIALNVGPNTITTVVKAQDGVSTKTYIITVTRQPSSDDYFKSLVLENPHVGLTPTSGAGYKNFTAIVGNESASIEVVPASVDANATIKINGKTVKSGDASAPIALNVGPNVIIMVITAQDGVSTKTIIVTVSRMPSSIATLSALKLSDGSLTPVFAPADTKYRASVMSGTTAIRLTPESSEPNASISVNGTPVKSGVESKPIGLIVGENTITTVVTAQDGKTSKVYSVIITRPSAIDYLSSLVLTKPHAALSPTTGPGYKNYTASVSSTTASITEIPAAADAGATIKVNGDLVKSGFASKPIALNTGDNTITTIVTAQDGVSTKTYIITVTKPVKPLNSVYQQLSVANPPQANPAPANDGIVVHPGISPNGDGINDFLIIDGITAYPENKLLISDRSGKLVFEAKGYNNSNKVFDGHSNKTGAMQSPGTYFYSLAYSVKGEIKHQTGFIVLKY